MHATRKGTNAGGMRRYNERLILSAIRRMNGASKADLARLTLLSPQAVARIVDELETGGLLVPAGKRTGGMGQPATIYRINGARGYTVGVEVGRSGLTLVLLNFDGECQATRHCPMSFPSINMVVREVDRFTDEHLAAVSLLNPRTFLGVGIAMPWFLGEWRDELGISNDQASEWRSQGVGARLREGIPWKLFFENDGNAATLAQFLCGAGLDLQNFLCANLGTFVGGGLVLGGRIVHGKHGNAGALASMPVFANGKPDYLIHYASLYALADAGEAERTAWVSRCSEALGFVIISANSLLDLEAVIIDGALPNVLLTEVVAAVKQRLHGDVPPDFFMPAIRVGALGKAAAAIGAGLLPLYSTFSPELAALSKGPADVQS